MPAKMRDLFPAEAMPRDDEKLRARILELYKSLPNGANRGWYEKMVSEIPGVGKVRVSRGTDGPGSVEYNNYGGGRHALGGTNRTGTAEP